MSVVSDWSLLTEALLIGNLQMEFELLVMGGKFSVLMTRTTIAFLQEM